jgi:bacterioferritin-associated ferredoxin
MPEEEMNLNDLYSMMRPKNVCMCRSVSEKTLVDTIHNGCHDLKELIHRTKASTKCGSCSLLVQSIFNREMKIIKAQKKIELSS